MTKPTILLLLLASSAFAQQTLQPVDSNALLKELQKIKETRQTSIKSQLGKVYQTVNSAASNGNAAMDLYLQSEYTTQFDGKGHEKTQFQDWKKKEADRLKSKGFQEALRLHLVYLSLTLQSSSGIKNSEMVPALTSYATQVQAESDLLSDDKEFMKRPLNDGMIVRALGVALTPTENWVMTPGNVDEMYQKIILPALREKKDAKAIEYWDRKLDKEYAAATDSERTFDADRFATLRRPALLWNRALEFYLIDQKNRGVAEMFAMIKAYPTHPDAAAWTTQLEQYLAPKEAAPAGPKP